jgi:hypothetical protein
MTTHRDIDSILDDWFSEGPERIADWVVDESLVTIERTPQVRGDLRLPRRLTMFGPLRTAGAAAAVVAVVAIGAGLLASNSQPPAGAASASPIATARATPSPTVAPSVTPAPTQPVAPSAALTPYRSPRHGYAIAYPSNWKYHSAPGTIDATTYPYDFSGGVDYFSATSPTVSDPGLIAAGPDVPAGTTLTSWITTIENMQATTLSCPAPDATEDITIGGDPGQVLTWNDCPVYLLWAGVVHGSHAYEVLLVDQWAVANPALQATDKALFLRILTSITFSIPATSATPSPS